MDFRIKAQIDKNALCHNLSLAQRLAPQSKIMAVVKANGYGHGAIQVASTLEGADGFAVARCDEALSLRALGEGRPILVMGGGYTFESVCAAAECRLILAVHHSWQIDLLESLPLRSVPKCVLKIDTGMHRLGLAPEQVSSALARLRRLGCLGEQPVFMTHMACADDTSSDMTNSQWEIFKQIAEYYQAEVTAANSAVMLSRPDMHGTWVRPGIMLYGASPFIDRAGPDIGLKPVMTLQAPLLAVKTIRKGETVGYGATWRAPEDMPLGIIGIGYGDGYPRHAPTGTAVLLGQVQVPLVGRVSMDMITVDLRNHPSTRIGDWATLWGAELPIDLLAQAADTIPYQLFCNITSRVSIVYT